MAKRKNKKVVLELIRRVNGIGPKLADKIWDAYGNDTEEMIVLDPKRVAREIGGVSVKRAFAAREQLLAASSEPMAAADPLMLESVTVSDHSVLAETTDADAGLTTATPGQVVPDVLTKHQVREVMLRQWDTSHAQRRHADEVLKRHYEKLLDQPNVTGAHVGFRRRGGGRNAESVSGSLEVCIRIHVNRKFPSNSAAFNDYRIALEIPPTIEGVPTDVTERSYATLDLPDLVEAQPAAVDTGEFETELMGGIEIAKVGMPFNGGTLGGIVFAGFQRRLITNQHVAGKIASKVNQPASGTVPPGFSAEIGTVVDSEMPPAGGTGSIDCAIIALRSGGRDVRPKIKGLQPPRFRSAKLTSPDVHRTTAIKVGAVTGRTEGIVKSVSTFVDVNGAKMPNQIIVESEDGSEIIKGGDSGSLLLVKASDDTLFNVVGLVHARSSDGTAMVATHFDEIETRFAVKASL